jgi:exopolysaccharide production protein ExoZ
MTDGSKPRKFLKGVQTLRAVAALGVVLFHASGAAHAPLAIGEARVDLFFDISGLVLWGMRQRYASAGAFVSDRFFRLVPLYWLATAGVLAGALLHFYSHLRLSTPWIAGSFLFIPTPSPNQGSPNELWPLLTQGWTMNYEMFFYALFAAMLLMPAKRHLLWLGGAILSLVALGAIFRFTAPAMHFYTNLIMLEFLAGVAIALLMAHELLPPKWFALVLLAIGVVALFSSQIAALDAPRVVVRGIPAALILLAVVSLEETRVPVANAALLFLGNASFSIYLFHDFGVSLAHWLLGGFAGPVATVIYGHAGVAAGLCAYWVLERPYVDFIKRVRREGWRQIWQGPAPARPDPG